MARPCDIHSTSWPVGRVRTHLWLGRHACLTDIVTSRSFGAKASDSRPCWTHVRYFLHGIAQSRTSSTARTLDQIRTPRRMCIREIGESRAGKTELIAIWWQPEPWETTKGVQLQNFASWIPRVLLFTVSLGHCILCNPKPSSTSSWSNTRTRTKYR